MKRRKCKATPRWAKFCDGCKRMGGQCPYRDKARDYRAVDKRTWMKYELRGAEHGEL